MTHTYVNWITAKTINGKYGEFYKVSVNIEKLKQFQNEKGYVNLLMNKRKEVGQYGETHSFTLDDYTPKKDERMQELEDDLWF